MPRPRSVTDDQVIAATIAAIGKHGPAKLTLAHVADEIGLSPATLLQRFGSKAALLAAVGADAAHYAESAFDDAVAATDSPVEAITEALAGLAGQIKTRTELSNHLAMLQLDLTDPQLHRRASEQAAAVRRRLELLLREALDAGQLTGDVVAASLADTIYTAYNGSMITWAIDGSGKLQDWIRQRIGAVLAPYSARLG